MSIHMLFDQLKVGQVFERTSRYDKETHLYMKVAAFCVARFDSEGRFSHADNTTCNSINLKDGKPASFSTWDYVVVVLDSYVTSSPSEKGSVQTKSAVLFDDSDGGHDDGICIRDIDTYSP